MIIISHRGYWKQSKEKNTIAAFEKSFSLGFGTETDIRDFNGELVISHDIATSASPSFCSFLDVYKKHTVNGPLALNIKADGLQKKIKQHLADYEINNYFVFDMSLPDTLSYFLEDIKTFVRISEYEILNQLYEGADGVWIDGFGGCILTESLLQRILNDGKMACIVSEELHKRNYLPQWNLIKTFSDEILNSPNIVLCTDLPENALEFFHG